MVILQEILAEPYPSGVTILRDYIATKRIFRSGNATVRFETPPGQLQSDWGAIRMVIAGEPIHVHFNVNQLSYTCHFHFWGTDCGDAEHTYEGLLFSF